MSVPPGYFDRIAGSVNLPLLQGKLVVVVGVGTVGSQIVLELAKCGVGRFRLVDGDRLEESNRARHVLPERYVGMNKAEALTLHLAEEVPQSRPEAVPRYVDNALSDHQLDHLLVDADLIVAATDDREAQRRIGRRALALCIPAIFPALYGNEGGEVIVQLDPRFPCFFCWDGFRTNAEQLRGVTALNADTLPVLYAAIRLSLGILDPRSAHRRMMARGPNESPNQMFEQRDFAALRMSPLTQRPGCPSCKVGPSPLSKDATETWRAAERSRAALISQSQPVLQQTAPAIAPKPSHPATQRRSNADPGELMVSGLCVFAWWFFFTEGFSGFAVIWNPLAWIPVIGWLFYAFTSH
jgi:molybdopterin/thiamine biosynthesis adenylyltransferase